MAALDLNDMTCSSGLSSSVKCVAVDAADARMKPMVELRFLFFSSLFANIFLWVS